MDNAMIIKAHQNTVIHGNEYSGEKYHYVLENYSKLTYFFKPVSSHKKIHISFSLAQEAELIFFVIIPRDLETLSIDLDMIGIYSRAQVRGMYVLRENQHCSVVVNQNHEASHSSTDVLFKGVLKDSSIINFQSMTHIALHAPYSNAKTYHKNIVLSPHAQAYSKPQLEIENNDVQCAHGSAIGQLDALQVWYMQSRGIAADHARDLLVHGFFADTLDGVPADMVSMMQDTINSMSKSI